MEKGKERREWVSGVLEKVEMKKRMKGKKREEWEGMGVGEEIRGKREKVMVKGVEKRRVYI